MTELRSITFIFSNDGTVTYRVRYLIKNGPKPGTVRRRKEVAELARQGVAAALKALSRGVVDVVGESGFEDRTDSLKASANQRGEQTA